MARSRNIKPGLFKNEELAECSVWARYIFPGLWMLADREGRLEDRPKRIKGDLLPYDTQDVEPLLRELAQRGFLVRYEVDGAGYIQISKFSKHQNPHHREPASTIPPPPNSPGLEVHANGIKPQAEPASHVPEALGKPEASAGYNGHETLGRPQASPEPAPLIPDSLTPESRETPLSGKPDVTKPEEWDFKQPPPAELEAEYVLAFLNRVTGSRYQAVEANLKLVRGRLKEVSIAEIKRVIVTKSEEWEDNPEMEQYLRPATLFNATKFAQYVGALPRADA